MRILTCAIHQPNFLPRLSTLAKLHTADIWIVLDDVQLNHRDYQHRARLAGAGDGCRPQWLSLPVHRPFGRATRINEVRLVESARSAHRVVRLMRQHYGSAAHWNELQKLAQEVAAMLTVCDRLAEVTEFSTRLLLDRLGWRGIVVRSSEFAARQERSARLADLALAVGADRYLCGTGGGRYLDEQPFREHGIAVQFFGLDDRGTWAGSRRLSAVHWIATSGIGQLRQALTSGPLGAV